MPQAQSRWYFYIKNRRTTSKVVLPFLTKLDAYHLYCKLSPKLLNRHNERKRLCKNPLIRSTSISTKVDWEAISMRQTCDNPLNRSTLISTNITVFIIVILQICGNPLNRSTLISTLPNHHQEP